MAIGPPDSAVPFREGLFKMPDAGSGPRLIGSRCPTCSLVDFPKRDMCPECLEQEVEEITLGPIGSVYSFSVVRYQKVAPPGHVVPYAFGFVDLPEGVRVLTKIVADDLELLEVGMEAELEVVVLGDPAETTTVAYQFRARL